jgi:hypothetical protein
LAPYLLQSLTRKEQVAGPQRPYPCCQFTHRAQVPLSVNDADAHHSRQTLCISEPMNNVKSIEKPCAPRADGRHGQNEPPSSVPAAARLDTTRSHRTNGGGCGCRSPPSDESHRSAHFESPALHGLSPIMRVCIDFSSPRPRAGLLGPRRTGDLSRNPAFPGCPAVPRAPMAVNERRRIQLVRQARAGPGRRPGACTFMRCHVGQGGVQLLSGLRSYCGRGYQVE